MIFKIVTLFLVVMMVLAMFGRLRVPGADKLKNLRKPVRKCNKCGRYKLGRGPCDCTKGT